MVCHIMGVAGNKVTNQSQSCCQGQGYFIVVEGQLFVQPAEKHKAQHYHKV